MRRLKNRFHLSRKNKGQMDEILVIFHLVRMSFTKRYLFCFKKVPNGAGRPATPPSIAKSTRGVEKSDGACFARRIFQPLCRKTGGCGGLKTLSHETLPFKAKKVAFREKIWVRAREVAEFRPNSGGANLKTKRNMRSEAFRRHPLTGK